MSTWNTPTLMGQKYRQMQTAIPGYGKSPVQKTEERFIKKYPC